jgi:hypothetical protein
MSHFVVADLLLLLLRPFALWSPYSGNGTGHCICAIALLGVSIIPERQCRSYSSNGVVKKQHHEAVEPITMGLYATSQMTIAGGKEARSFNCPSDIARVTNTPLNHPICLPVVPFATKAPRSLCSLHASPNHTYAQTMPASKWCPLLSAGASIAFAAADTPQLSRAWCSCCCSQKTIDGKSPLANVKYTKRGNCSLHALCKAAQHPQVCRAWNQRGAG